MKTKRIKLLVAAICALMLLMTAFTTAYADVIYEPEFPPAMPETDSINVVAVTIILMLVMAVIAAIVVLIVLLVKKSNRLKKAEKELAELKVKTENK